jgi:hypothetical protein
VRANVVAAASIEASSSEKLPMATGQGMPIVFQLRQKKSHEAIIVNAFSSLKLLMMRRRKIHHELQLVLELYLKRGSSVVALVVYQLP